jgi:hypothetical protein
MDSPVTKVVGVFIFFRAPLHTMLLAFGCRLFHVIKDPDASSSAGVIRLHVCSVMTGCELLSIHQSHWLEEQNWRQHYYC